MDKAYTIEDKKYLDALDIGFANEEEFHEVLKRSAESFNPALYRWEFFNDTTDTQQLRQEDIDELGILKRISMCSETFRKRVKGCPTMFDATISLLKNVDGQPTVVITFPTTDVLGSTPTTKGLAHQYPSTNDVQYVCADEKLVQSIEMTPGDA